jgi:hypothetical protein
MSPGKSGGLGPPDVLALPLNYRRSSEEPERRCRIQADVFVEEI